MKKNSYDENDILICTQGELFGQNKPRLPAPPMLMIDRVTEINHQGGQYKKGELIAQLDLNPDMWFFACHFIHDHVMPGCLGVDALWQLVGFYLAWSGYSGKGRALGSGAIRFSGQILPSNKRVQYRIEIKRIISRKLIMATADGSVSVDGEIVYTASDLRVGLFEQKILDT
ncbi:MAG: bifunctional 3-hydroxydecanoyl-ACP dehydratase/trans-2-decenoyl-ACP isomerase [Endozoicomonadaceae bacterium]|nr:bifunctional 3-hydroxydecanoyl-ACP dehydratase/trans-2-decenoyl-ACP isomerase [Endozoicomonadaceae bacterium]MBE8233695.1 bifunctional 3-hydroxydecanoyl-ACP dehydratase/trans-2-decenoyl-ACP isomerase [Endozoicomonadaceae bacterium]